MDYPRCIHWKKYSTDYKMISNQTRKSYRVGGSTSVEASTGVVVSAKGWEAARRECILMSAELGKSVATR